MNNANGITDPLHLINMLPQKYFYYASLRKSSSYINHDLILWKINYLYTEIKYSLIKYNKYSTEFPLGGTDSTQNFKNYLSFNFKDDDLKYLIDFATPVKGLKLVNGSFRQVIKNRGAYYYKCVSTKFSGKFKEKYMIQIKFKKFELVWKYP